MSASLTGVTAGRDIHIGDTVAPTSSDRLRIFEQTPECKKLLTNPEKIGFVLVWKNPLFAAFMVLCVLAMSYLLIFYGKPLFLLVDLVLYGFLFLGLVGAIIYFFTQLQLLLNGELRIMDVDKPVICLPCFIKKSQANKFLLETSDGKRTWIIAQRSSLDTATNGDVGVAYIREQPNFPRVLLEFRRMESN